MDRMNLNNAIMTGSLRAISQASGKSLAESFLNCDAIVIIDTSGSMGANDSRGGKSRYDVAQEELTQLQATLPGKIALIVFSSDVQFCPSGIAPFLCGGTDMLKALNFVKVADVDGMKFILISDGLPDSANEVLAKAKTFKNKIFGIYVGPENDIEGGRAFLEKLSKCTGGESITADRAMELAGSIQTLLLKG